MKPRRRTPRPRLKVSSSDLPGERQQHFIREHLEVRVFPQSAPIQPVVDDGVVDQPSSVGEPAGHFLPEALEVDGGKRLEVFENLRLVGGTEHGALPHGGVPLWTVAVLVVDGTWVGKELVIRDASVRARGGGGSTLRREKRHGPWMV